MYTLGWRAASTPISLNDGLSALILIIIHWNPTISSVNQKVFKKEDDF